MRRTLSLPALAWVLAVLALVAPACMKKSVVAPQLEPRCLVSPTALSFGAARVGDRAGAQSFTITNDGQGILSGTVADSCGPFVVTSGGGPVRLGPGASRTVAVEFRPTITGDVRCELSLGGGIRCAAIVCSGTGTSRYATCELTPALLSFGEQALGACSLPETLTVANTGGDTLVGTVPGACGPFTVASGSGAFRLAPGRSRSVAVQFCPAAAGPVRCDLSLGGNVACPAVPCTGTGIVVQPACQISPSTLDFGDQSAGQCSARQSLTITNQGTGTLVGAVPAACGPFTVTSGSGSFSLAPGQSLSVTVSFCPTSTGAAACDLALIGSVSCSPVRCSGTGVPPPSCRVSPASLAFGTLGVGTCSDTQSVTITNTGVGPLTGIVPASCGPYAVTAGSGAFSLAGGDSRRVTVKFCPADQGFVSCDLSFGANVTCAAVPCYGVGACTDSVFVSSVPAGATIYLDNESTQELTPHVFTLTKGPHLFRVQRHGVTYFAPQETVLTVPCRGTRTVVFVGHHVMNFPADASTWIGQSAPTENHCTAPDLYVGQDSVGGNTRGALIHVLPTFATAWRLFRASLAVHEFDCESTTASLGVKAYPLDQEWSACAPTWDQPGVTWSGAPASPALRLACPPSWRVFDVTAAVSHWIEGSEPARGWILLPASRPGGLSLHRFNSTHAASAADYPYLTLDYVEKVEP